MADVSIPNILNSTDIDLTLLTNGSVINKEWTGTGILDVLFKIVNENIKLQYDTGRIKGTDYANTYLNAIQAILAQGVQLYTQEKLTEAQIDSIKKDIELKELQAQEQSYKVTTLLPDEHNRNLEDIETANKQQLLLDKQISELDYKLTTILPEQVKQMYVERVIKDKEAASLGMDNTIKKFEELSKTNPNAIYTPVYVPL